MENAHCKECKRRHHKLIFQSTTKESVETFLWTLVFIVLEERLQIMYDNTEKS